MYTLDAKDRKIYYLLSENARMSAREIGRRTRLSKTAVLNRIEQMITAGYIEKILAITNFQALGAKSCDIFFKIKQSPESEQRARKILQEHPAVIWAGSLSGRWDFFAQIAAMDRSEAKKHLGKIKKSLGNIVEKYEIKFDIERLKIERKLFHHEKETGYSFTPNPAPDVPAKLGELDKKILSYVCNVDGWAPYSIIAKNVGASMETTRNRLIALMKSGVIVRYSVVHGGSHGIFDYFIFVELKPAKKKRIEELYRYLHTNEEVKILFSPHGREEFYFTFPTASPIEVDRLVKEIRNKFGDVITDVDHALITHEISLHFFPKALMKS